nr:hypothetical protein [uncultured Cohaesibacter sp.]
MLDWADAESKAAREKAMRKPSCRQVEETNAALASERDLTRVTVENPDGRGSMERVTKRVRDPIENLYSQGKLDDAQHKAAHMVRRAVEGMGTSIGSVDPERIRVDGGRAGDPAIYMLEAAETLRRVQKAVEAEMGKEGWAIVRRVAGYGEALSVVAMDFAVSLDDLKNGGVSREARAYASRALQRGLNCVVGEFGMSGS